jgi:hypothetical protein
MLMIMLIFFECICKSVVHLWLQSHSCYDACLHPKNESGISNDAHISITYT